MPSELFELAQVVPAFATYGPVDVATLTGAITHNARRFIIAPYRSLVSCDLSAIERAQICLRSLKFRSGKCNQACAAISVDFKHASAAMGVFATSTTVQSILAGI